MSYVILTASAIESNRLQQERWIPSANLVPVTLLHRGVLAGLTDHGNTDLFYTDGALDALVTSAARVVPNYGAAMYAAADVPWLAWRAARGLFRTVRPMEAWEWLHEASLEELEERGRSGLAVISSVTRLASAAVSMSYLDLINYERRHCAADVRAKAADRLVRIAAGRIVVTEEQVLNEVIIRATWTALPAADRKAPEWLVNGTDTPALRPATLAGA